MNTLDETARHFREARRKAWWTGFIVGAAAMLLACSLVGCASTSILTEVEHVSHPTTPERREVGLSQASVLLRLRDDSGFYLDAGLGYNLQGRGGGGFVGSPLTGTVRVGKEWRLFK